MGASLFTTFTQGSTGNATWYQKVGFNPGRVQIVNYTAMATPTDGEAYKAEWLYGMTSGYALISTYKNNGGDLVSLDTVATSNGITLISATHPAARFGAIVSGFTNASPGVLTVDATTGITAGCVIKVEAIADDQTGTNTLNGTFTVASVTATTITTTTNTSVTGYSVYVSGGFVTVVTNANPTSPNPPFNIYSDVEAWYNQAFYGFSVGSACMANADAADLYLISVWDRNTGGI